MSYPIKLFLFLSLTLILCQKQNEKQSTNSQNSEAKNDINSADESFQQNETEPFNVTMTDDEMDTIMLCTVVVQESLRKQKKELENAAKNMKLNNSNLFFEKLGTDYFEKCYKNINISLVHKYVNNLTFDIEFKWEKPFDEYTKFEEKKYNNKTSFNFTEAQQELMYKFKKVNELFQERSMRRRQKFEEESKKIKIGKIDMESIPFSFKIGIFTTILILFFGGIFYFLKTLNKAPEKKKKKKKVQ